MQKLHRCRAKSACVPLGSLAYFRANNKTVMDERTIKASIKRLREELGATQEDFSASLGMDASTYWRLEEGNTRIVNKNIYRIAKRTGRSVEEVLFGTEGLSLLREDGRAEEQIAALKEYYESVIANLNDYIRILKDQLAARD